MRSRRLIDVKRPRDAAKASSLYDRVKMVRPDMSMDEFTRECQKRGIELNQEEVGT